VGEIEGVGLRRGVWKDDQERKKNGREEHRDCRKGRKNLRRIKEIL
jgi:hypothetical protein